MRFRSGATEIRVSLLLIVFPVLMRAAGCLKEYSAAFFFIMLHELSHIAVAVHYGARPDFISITPVGFSAAINIRNMPEKALLKMYLAGPAANLALCASALLAGQALSGMEGFMKLISSTNLLLALFNLLPVYPLDGGKILIELLSGHLGFKTAGMITRRLALILSAVLLLAGAFQFYAAAGNISLVIIGLYIQVVLKTSEMESAFMNIRQILYRRLRLMKKGIYPARDLVVVKGMKVYESLKSMDFDRFHIVYVLDENFRLAKVFTEAEIIDALAGNGENVTFENLIEKCGSLQTNSGEERYN